MKGLFRGSRCVPRTRFSLSRRSRNCHAAAFPSLVKEAKTVLFPEKEKKELRGGADGHVLAISEYEPGSEYTYYWGSAWDKAAIKTVDAWNAYMAEYAQKVRTPLTVTY